MAINILQELNLGAAKASFSRDEVETLAEIKNLDVAKKYPNNYDIFCKEDGCKYRLNKTSHSTMQDNLPHPTGKWRRVDSVISSSMPAPITTGDVILYLGPIVMDQVDHTKVKFQTGKYYRTEYTKVSKQMYAFVQNTAPDTPDTSPTPAVIWFSETSTLSEGSVLFTPVNGSIFDNKEHGIIMTSDWDGQSAISGSSYEYLDNSNSTKLGMVRNSNFDTTFDSYPELTWNMFDTEAELENIKQNVIPEAISSASEEIKTEVKTEVKEDVDANLGQAKKLNDILTDGDIRLLKQGGTEKLVSSKPDATVSDSTIGFVQCDCNRNEETGEVTLNITNVKYGPFTSEEIAENAFVDENEIIVPSGGEFNIYAITCSVTNKAKDTIFCALKDSNLYKGTLGFDAMSFISRLQEGLPLVVGFAVAAPYKDDEHTGSVDSSTYVSMYNLLELIDAQSSVNFTPIPVSEIPDIKNRTVELLEKETVLDLILYVMCPEGFESQPNVLELLNEQFVIGTEASGILNEFPTMRKEIEDSISGEFSNVKKLNDALNEEDVDAIISRPRESLFDVKSPYIPYGNKLLTECTFVKLELDENGVATITDSATVSDAISLDNPPEWIHEGCFAILFGIMQKGSNVGYRYTDTDVYNCSFKVDYDRPDLDINRKPENMFGIKSVYFAVGNNGDEWGDIKADFTACKFTDINTYADGTADVDGRHLLGDLIGDYEEDGTPITLRNYSKSDYTVLYGIALFTSSGNVISEADYTAKNIVASINKRVVPAYQESGLLVDFPKMEEQVDSVKEQIAAVKESDLPEKTKEYIKNNIVDYKNLTLSGVQNYNSSNFTHFVSLGVETYNHSDDNRTIAPVFINYFDNTKDDYAASSTVPVFHPNKNKGTWDTYVGIVGYLDTAQTKQALVDKLKGIKLKYNRDVSYFDEINKYFFIKDAYVKISGATIADFIDSAGWVRVEPDSNLGEVFENIPDIMFGNRCAQVVIVVDGHYGDYSFDDIEYFETNFNNIMQLIRFENDILASKLEESGSSGDISALEERTSAIETKLEPLADDVSVLSDATKSIIQKYPIKLATFYDSKFNGALKINADTYDPETTTSVSLSFYNYYDSSKDDYRNPANPATPMLVEDKFVAVAAYIDIPEVLGIPPYSSAPQLKEYCKNISVRFDRTQSIKVDLQNNNNTSIYSGANVFIRDIYFRTYSTTQAPALASYTYSTKITNSNPIDALVDASYSPGFIPIFVFILEVIPDANYQVPLKNYLAQQNFTKFINSLCEISFNKVRDTEDKAEEAIENISSVAGDISAIETKLEPLTDEVIHDLTNTEKKCDLIYGCALDGLLDAFIHQTNPTVLDIEDQKTKIEAAIYLDSSDFTESDYTADDGREVHTIGYTGSSQYSVPTDLDIIDREFTNEAESGNVSYENKIADITGNEEGAEVFDRIFRTSSVNDDDCLMVTNMIILPNGERSAVYSDIDSVYTNNIFVELGTFECDTFKYDIDEVYLGLAIYVDILKLAKAAGMEDQISENIGFYKMMRDFNDNYTSYIRVGLRDLVDDSKNSIQMNIGDLFSVVESKLAEIVSNRIEEIKDIGSNVGMDITDEHAKDFIGIRLTTISYIHMYRDNPNILNINNLYTCNINNSLAEHIRIKSDTGRTFVEDTNNKLESVQRQINTVQKQINTVSESTLSNDQKNYLRYLNYGFEKEEFIDNCGVKNIASLVNKKEYYVIPVDVVEKYDSDGNRTIWNGSYNGLVNLGQNYTPGASSINPQFMNYIDNSEDSETKDYVDIENVFTDMSDSSVSDDYRVGLFGLINIYDTWVSNNFDDITKFGDNPYTKSNVRDIYMSKLDKTGYFDGSDTVHAASRAITYPEIVSKGQTAQAAVSVEDVYVTIICRRNNDTISSLCLAGNVPDYTWIKWDPSKSLFELLQYADDSKIFKINDGYNYDIAVITVLSIRKGRNAETSEIFNYFKTYNFYKNIDKMVLFSENAGIEAEKAKDEADRLTKSIDSINYAKYYPTPIAFKTSAKPNVEDSEHGNVDFNLLVYPRIVPTPTAETDGTYTVKLVPNDDTVITTTTLNDIFENNSLYMMLGFFGENLFNTIYDGDYSYVSGLGTVENLNKLNRASGIAWYSNQYLKDITDSFEDHTDTSSKLSRQIDCSELFLNVNAAMIKEIYVAVIPNVSLDGGRLSKLGDIVNIKYDPSTGNVINDKMYNVIADIPGFRKVPFSYGSGVHSISMEDIIDLCGRPQYNTNFQPNGANIVFVIHFNENYYRYKEINDYYKDGSSTLKPYNIGFFNDSIYNFFFWRDKYRGEDSTNNFVRDDAIYITKSVSNSIKHSKNVSLKAAKDAVADRTKVPKFYSSLSNLKDGIENGGMGYLVKVNPSDNTKYLADVYVKTLDGSLIKMTSDTDCEPSQSIIDQLT